MRLPERLKNWIIDKLGGYTAADFNRMCDAVREQDKAIERLMEDIGELRTLSKGEYLMHVTVGHAKPYRCTVVVDDYFYGVNAIHEGIRRCKDKLVHGVMEQVKFETYRDPCTGKVQCAAELWVLEKEAKYEQT